MSCSPIPILTTLVLAVLISFSIRLPSPLVPLGSFAPPAVALPVSEIALTVFSLPLMLIVISDFVSAPEVSLTV